MPAILEEVIPLERYLAMPDAELSERIDAARTELGPRVVILGHHYQRDDVIAHADLTGDSYQLSVMASRTDAEFIIFCGVHFMAESADILGRESQRVILPDMGAGCSMADMASIDQVEDGGVTFGGPAHGPAFLLEMAGSGGRRSGGRRSAR